MKRRTRRPGKPGVAEAAVPAAALRRLASPTKGRLVHINDWEDLASRAAYSSSRLARLCHISLRQLQRHFRDAYEVKLGSWLNDLRLWRALLSLRSERAVKEVSYALGYKQCSHFSREFKKYHGIPPSAVPVLKPHANHIHPRDSRLSSPAQGPGLLGIPGVFVDAPPRQTAGLPEGPFYPSRLPPDTDNDLVIVNESLTTATGEITHLSGRLLDARGRPIRNGMIEIWSVDHAGVYLGDRANHSKFDSHFQGFGRFLTGSTGEYYFRTVKPVCYPGHQAPHINFKVKLRGRDPWTTQLFIRGFPGNEHDAVYRHIGDEHAKASVTADFVPLKASSLGELAARFEIVLGVTVDA